MQCSNTRAQTQTSWSGDKCNKHKAFTISNCFTCDQIIPAINLSLGRYVAASMVGFPKNRVIIEPTIMENLGVTIIMPTRLIIGVWFENFNVPSRTSNKLWTSTKASRKMEERSSYGKTGNKHDDVQVVLQPSSKRIIFFPALCPSKKSLLSLPSPSC